MSERLKVLLLFLTWIKRARRISCLNGTLRLLQEYRRTALNWFEITEWSTENFIQTKFETCAILPRWLAGPTWEMQMIPDPIFLPLSLFSVWAQVLKANSGNEERISLDLLSTAKRPEGIGTGDTLWLTSWLVRGNKDLFFLPSISLSYTHGHIVFSDTAGGFSWPWFGLERRRSILAEERASQHSDQR